MSSIAFRLERTVSVMLQALDRALKAEGIDLPHSQYDVLRLLYEEDCRSQASIAAALTKDAAAIKRTIDNLERKGLVARRAVSGRENQVALTARAKALQNKMIAVGVKTVEQFLDGITDDELTTAETVLRKLSANAERK